MQPANRVVVNTVFLYGKMLFTMVISLFSTRLILVSLGATDYGIFSLIAGVIAMLSFLNGAMTLATQRFMSYSIGEGNGHKLQSIFSSSVVLHLIIGVIIIILLEFGGILLFNGTLNIPSDRIYEAKVVFHCMVISTFFTINAVPYDASINAHEDFFFDALAGVLESLLKLGIAVFLIYTDVDKLILYGILIASVTILIRVIKSIYCVTLFKECRIKRLSLINIELTKKMFSFAGWNLFGALCSVVRNQGLAVVLNLFFGVVMNAAYGIATQVNGQLSAFSSNMVRALYPQIIKSEGSGDHERMLRLAILAGKVSFFLLTFFAIPLIIEMPYVLGIWLKTVPEHTIVFCRLILILSLLQQLSVGLMASVNAVGEVKVYQIVVGSLLILNLPLSYGLMVIGFPGYSVLIGSIFLESVALSLRIWFASRIAGLNIVLFTRGVLLSSVSIGIMTFILGILPRLFLEEGLLRAFLTFITCIICIMIFGKYIALSHDENNKIGELIRLFKERMFAKGTNYVIEKFSNK